MGRSQRMRNVQSRNQSVPATAISEQQDDKLPDFQYATGKGKEATPCGSTRPSSIGAISDHRLIANCWGIGGAFSDQCSIASCLDAAGNWQRDTARCSWHGQHDGQPRGRRRADPTRRQRCRLALGVGARGSAGRVSSQPTVAAGQPAFRPAVKPAFKSTFKPDRDVSSRDVSSTSSSITHTRSGLVTG